MYRELHHANRPQGPMLTEEENIRKLRAILGICPDFFPAIFSLGGQEAMGGRSHKARRLLLEGADRMAGREPQPKEQRLGHARGVCDLLEDELLRHDLIRDFAERLIRHYPREPAFRSTLGVALLFLGQEDEGIRSLEEAVALAPESSHHLTELAWGCMEAGRLEEARTHLERAFTLDPGDSWIAHLRRLMPALEESGASLREYMLRPLDRETFARLEADALASGNGEDLRREIMEWNRDRVSAWRGELGRHWKEHEELDRFGSALAFFMFFEWLATDWYILLDELDLFRPRFEMAMGEFIRLNARVDRRTVEAACDGVLDFYSFLSRKGLVEEEALSDFRAEVQKQKPVLAGMADGRM
jgi:tetratricopeptide (TPR) repeat protein